MGKFDFRSVVKRNFYLKGCPTFSGATSMYLELNEFNVRRYRFFFSHIKNTRVKYLAPLGYLPHYNMYICTSFTHLCSVTGGMGERYLITADV